MSSFWQFLTFKWEFSGGSDWYHQARIPIDRIDDFKQDSHGNNASQYYHIYMDDTIKVDGVNHERKDMVSESEKYDMIHKNNTNDIFVIIHIYDIDNCMI